MEQERLDYAKVSPELNRALLALNKAAKESGLEAKLLELVKLEASILNRCVFCLDMHQKDARAMGETEQRILGLAAWREAPYYTERERVALEWTEAVTLVAETGVPRETFDRVKIHFSEKELVDLTFNIAVINSFNRLAVSFRKTTGAYVSPHKPA